PVAHATRLAFAYAPGLASSDPASHGKIATSARIVAASAIAPLTVNSGGDSSNGTGSPGRQYPAEQTFPDRSLTKCIGHSATSYQNFAVASTGWIGPRSQP